MNCIKVWNSQQIRIRAANRYICLTDMAQASGKQVGHWTSLQSATEFIQVASTVIGIPITELVIIKQGGIPEEQGTWAHPKVAIQFAQWCSPLFALQVSTWVEELMTTGAVQLGGGGLTNIEKAEASCRLVDVIFSGVPLKPELIAGVKINMTEQLAPELAGCFDYARQLLIGNTAQELELLTVTKLGALLNLSAVATNKKLIEAGLQVKNDKKRSKKDSSYLPTGQGLEFSDLTLATGEGKDNTTYQQLRWYPSVLELLV